MRTVTVFGRIIHATCAVIPFEKRAKRRAIHSEATGYDNEQTSGKRQAVPSRGRHTITKARPVAVVFPIKRQHTVRKICYEVSLSEMWGTCQRIAAHAVESLSPHGL